MTSKTRPDRFSSHPRMWAAQAIRTARGVWQWSFKGSLRAKIIFWTFVPTAIILLAVALVNFYAYQQVTEELVLERDQDRTRLSAGQLMTEFGVYVDLLETLARTIANYQNDQAAQRDTLKGASNRLAVFDAGVLFLDTFGTVVAAESERPDLIGMNWSDRDYYRQILHAQILGSPTPIFSDIVADGPDGVDVIVFAVPVVGEQGEYLGVLAGLFRVGATSGSTFYGEIIKMRIGEGGRVYLVDGNGRLIYHTDSDRIGENLASQSLVQQVLNGQTGAVRTQSLEGRDIVAAFAPMPGTPWGLVTEESWATLTSGSRGYQGFLILLLVLGVLVPVLVVFFGVRQLTQPISGLIRAAQEVAEGNFGQAITAQTGDEIEELAEQFNVMSAQLQESYAHLEQRVADRTRELAALNAVATVVGRSLDLDEVLVGALEKTLDVTGLKAGVVYLYSDKVGVATIAVYRGLSPEFVAGIDNLKPGEGFSGRVIQTGEPMIVQDLATDPRLTRQIVKEEGFHSAAIVPLVARGEVLGSLSVMTRDYREFSEQNIELLTSIGTQVGVAVENARLYTQAEERMEELEALYEQAKQIAVFEERQRLARELHDAVTQTLFSASLIAEVIPRLWERDPHEARSRLQELHELTRGALAEMRALLLELRPASLEEAELGDLLRQLAESITGRARVAVALQIDGECDVPNEAKVALYRIAQEALNNVAKHAGAAQATLALCSGLDKLTMEISDDGRGFDPEDVAAEHLGLGIMRERAESIGADLSIESRVGGGTRVSVTWNVTINIPQTNVLSLQD